MRKVEKIKRICPVCNETFEVLPCRIKKGKGIFCSRSCAMKKEHNPNWIGGSTTKTCQECWEEFRILTCRVKRGEGEYCSKRCLGRANGRRSQEDMQGDKNPNWKGGIETENHKVRTSLEYEDWRKQIFKRDDYACQACKQRGTILNAHHINAFNGSPELRIKIDNGITLCEKCHRNFHHQYGNNCTRDQLNEFIGR